MTSRPATQLLNMKEIETRVRKAKKEKKIFSITGGFQTLRRCLLDRGWIEKTHEDLSLIPSSTERYATALMLKNYPARFIWQARPIPIKNRNVNPLSNTIARNRPFNFTSKNGLHSCVTNYKWHHVDGLTDLSYQRSHVLEDKVSKDEFIYDFNKTACTSFVMFLESKIENFMLHFTSSDDGISSECIRFAVWKVEQIIKRETNDEMDEAKLADSNFLEHEKKFFLDFRQITNGTRKLKLDSKASIDNLRNLVVESAQKIKKQLPRVKYDGFLNIWIVKPAGQSCGRGIQVFNNLDKIVQEAFIPAQTFVVQKYIEKPLLIHDRKFDLRIYFITFIRDGAVDFWLYKDCYVKFSTPPFSLASLDRSIHLTNYTVQKHFMNAENVVPNAVENMWSLAELKNYFKQIGKPNLWAELIYPKIKKNLLAVILSSLESTELTSNCFELNGADVLIAFDGEPVLIEINSRPAFYLSDAQIEMITRRLLEDVIKVVVDRQKDSEAFTGDFELVHTHTIPEVSPNPWLNLTLVGTRIEKFNARARVESFQSNKVKKSEIQVINVPSSFKEVEPADGAIYLKEKIHS